MKTLYLTSALILSLGGVALAQTAAPEAPPAAETAPAADAMPAADAAASTPAEAAKTGLLRASSFKGVDVYTIDVTGKTKWDDGVAYTVINTDWDKIGEVEDLVLNENGDVVGAIAEVGGFLGLGEKEVVLLPEEIAFVVTPDRIAVVSGLSKETLETREKAAEEAAKAQ